MKTWIKILIVVSAIVGTLLFTLIVLAVVTPSTTAPEAHKTPVQHTSTVQATPKPTLPRPSPQVTQPAKAIPVLTEKEYADIAGVDLHGKIVETDVYPRGDPDGPQLAFTVYVKNPTKAKIEDISTAIALNLSSSQVHDVLVRIVAQDDPNADQLDDIDMIPVHAHPDAQAFLSVEGNYYYRAGAFYVHYPDPL